MQSYRGTLITTREQAAAYRIGTFVMTPYVVAVLAVYLPWSLFLSMRFMYRIRKVLGVSPKGFTGAVRFVWYDMWRSNYHTLVRHKDGRVAFRGKINHDA